MTEAAKVHDYTNPVWGHSLNTVKIHEAEVPRTLWQRLTRQKPRAYSYMTCMGHGPYSFTSPAAERIKAGDIIEIEMQSGRIARFHVAAIHYELDAQDMFIIEKADAIGYRDEAEGEE